MKVTSIEVPEELTYLLKTRDKDLPKKVRELLAVELYREGVISLGKAAEIAGVSKWEMFEILAAKKIPLQYYPEDLEEDVKTLKRLLK